MKILIVDDNIELSNVLKEFLEINNYSVKQAYDGQEAFKIAMNEEYDLIFMDIIMPFMRGDDCIEALYNVDPKHKFFVISGEIQNIDKKRLESLREKGVLEFLHKPIDVKNIVNLIHKHFNA